MNQMKYFKNTGTVKHFISVFLIIGLLCSLAACSGKNSEGDKSGGNTSDPTQTALPSVDGAPASVNENAGNEEIAGAVPANVYTALDNKVCGFGFAKAPKGKVPDIGSYAKLIDNSKALYVGDTSQKNLYLTFDEGYENGFSGQILDTLKEKDCPAAFFVTGDYLKREPELIDRMINEGHIVGNHTWSHPTLPKIEDETKFKEELTKLDDYLAEKHGVKTTYFRYPNGEFSERSLKIVDDMGYKTVFWSTTYKDWERDVSRGADYAYDNIVNHVHDGAILLMHAVSKDNAEALGRIIDALRAEGYTFCSLDELNFEK